MEAQRAVEMEAQRAAKKEAHRIAEEEAQWATERQMISIAWDLRIWVFWNCLVDVILAGGLGPVVNDW